MLDRIERMRKKSRAERQRTTVFLSIGITAIIALVWGTVILPRVFTLNNRDSSRADASSPFKVFMESLGFIADDAKKGWTEVIDVFQGDNTEVENLDEKESDLTNGSVQKNLLEKGLPGEDFSRADESLADLEIELAENEGNESVMEKESKKSELEDEGSVLSEDKTEFE